jgi:hypothetical protein
MALDGWQAGAYRGATTHGHGKMRQRLGTSAAMALCDDVLTMAAQAYQRDNSHRDSRESFAPTKRDALTIPADCPREWLVR